MVLSAAYDSLTQTNVSGDHRETVEGWPLLTVETEANGDLWSKNERSPSLVGSLGSLYRYWRFLSCLGCYSQPSTKYFFLALYVPHRPAT